MKFKFYLSLAFGAEIAIAESRSEEGNETRAFFTEVSTFAGSISSGSVDGNGSSASFKYPYGITVDSNGIVFVADSRNHIIRKINSTGYVSTFAGSGSYGYEDGYGSSASFKYPCGIAVGSNGTVFVADTHNHMIRKIDSTGYVTTLAGSGSYGYKDGYGSSASFKYPHGVAVDSKGNIFVADSSNHLIRVITNRYTTSNTTASAVTQLITLTSTR